MNNDNDVMEENIEESTIKGDHVQDELMENNDIDNNNDSNNDNENGNDNDNQQVEEEMQGSEDEDKKEQYISEMAEAKNNMIDNVTGEEPTILQDDSVAIATVYNKADNDTNNEAEAEGATTNEDIELNEEAGAGARAGADTNTDTDTGAETNAINTEAEAGSEEAKVE